MNSDQTVLEAVWARDRKQDEVAVRSLLGRFLFSGDDAVGKRLRDLSGGERTRVALACLMVDRPNALVLDEPTNHLDIASREALEAALETYGGTLIMVSHDRYFINRLAQKLLVLDGAGGAPKLVLGNYETYERQRQEAASLAQSAAPKPKKPAGSPSEASAKEAPAALEEPARPPRRRHLAHGSGEEPPRGGPRQARTLLRPGQGARDAEAVRKGLPRARGALSRVDRERGDGEYSNE